MRWFLGGELVGGETPWWRDDWIPSEVRWLVDLETVVLILNVRITEFWIIP